MRINKVPKDRRDLDFYDCNTKDNQINRRGGKT